MISKPKKITTGNNLTKKGWNLACEVWESYHNQEIEKLKDKIEKLKYWNKV